MLTTQYFAKDLSINSLMGYKLPFLMRFIGTTAEILTYTLAQTHFKVLTALYIFNHRI